MTTAIDDDQKYNELLDRAAQYHAFIEEAMRKAKAEQAEAGSDSHSAGALSDRWWNYLIATVDGIWRFCPASAMPQGLYRACTCTAAALADLRDEVTGWHDEQAAHDVFMQAGDLVYELEQRAADIVRQESKCMRLACKAASLAAHPGEYLDDDARDDGIEP